MQDCLFCKIVSGEIPSTKVYEDDLMLAFRDISPITPSHILVIPKTHIASVAGITEDNAALIGHIFVKIAEIAGSENLTSDGFRVVSNCGEHAGQTVHHLHFHVLGGRQMTLNLG